MSDIEERLAEIRRRFLDGAPLDGDVKWLLALVRELQVDLARKDAALRWALPWVEAYDDLVNVRDGQPEFPYELAQAHSALAEIGEDVVSDIEARLTEIEEQALYLRKAMAMAAHAAFDIYDAKMQEARLAFEARLEPDLENEEVRRVRLEWNEAMHSGWGMTNGGVVITDVLASIEGETR